jgi:hypothetical protein
MIFTLPKTRDRRIDGSSHRTKSLPLARALVAVAARRAVLLASLAVVAASVAVPTAHAEDAAPPPPPAISEEAAAAVAAMKKTLETPALSFTARTMRVYLDDDGQPLHIFHTVKVVARFPDRVKIQVNGDDGANELYYDGNQVSVFSPDRAEYAMLAVPGSIEAALNEALGKLHIDFPLVNFFAVSPDRSLLSGAVAGWQVGTSMIEGVECRHLVFLKKGDVDLELWVENNKAATPRRLIVTYRLLPGQPSFLAEFTNWDSRVQPADAVFAFRAPPKAKQIALNPPVVPGQQGAQQ